MDLLADYYPYLEVKAKGVDEIYRELSTDPIYGQNNDGTWKETFINRFGEMMVEMPDVRKSANRALREGLLKKGIDVDPETVYYNRFNHYVPSSGAKLPPGYVMPSDPQEYNHHHTGEMLVESYRLTDAALMNSFAQQYAGSEYLMKRWRVVGIYKVGKEGSVDPINPKLGRCWGPHNSAFQAYEPGMIVMSKPGIQGEYTKDYDAFWNKYGDLYKEILAEFFLLAAIKQYKDGLLTDNGFAVARKVYAKQADVSTYWFNVNTYKANDILVMESWSTGMYQAILYIPGASSPFLEFESLASLKTWITRHLSDSVAMAAFLEHFSIYNREDGPTYSGVATFAKNMAAGKKGWDSQYYMLLKPQKIAYDNVFGQVRDQLKAAMHNDAEKQITTNSEIYKSYALSFVRSALVFTDLLEMLVPKIGIPLNIILSVTALGLGVDIAVNGDTLQQRMDGIGGVADGAAYLAMNLLPVISSGTRSLRTFRRPTADIPAFALSEQILKDTFNIQSLDALAAIKPTDPAHIINHASGELRLVRLADGGSPLAVLRKVSGNKFARINPFTFKELRGEKLISEALNEKGVRVYVSGSGLVGGAPFNPYDNFFSEIWIKAELAAKADGLGSVDSLYTAIKEKLGQVHAATDFDRKQLAAHELLSLLDEYKVTYPSAARLPILKDLHKMVYDRLYERTFSLRYELMDPQKPLHPFVKSQIYSAAHAEMLGELPFDTTWALVKFAQSDPVFSIPRLSEAAQRTIPDTITFPVKYVIDDLKNLLKLGINLSRLPEYSSLGLVGNKSVFEYALRESKRLGLFTKIEVSKEGTVFPTYIGHSYDEMLAMSEGAGIHPRTVMRLIEALSEGGEAGIMSKFGRTDYFHTFAMERLDNLRKNLDNYSPSNFYRYDDAVESFSDAFDSMRDETLKLEQMMTSERGIVMRNGPAEMNLIRQKLAYFKEQGVTHIGITHFVANLHQAELDAFMGGGFLTGTLQAIIRAADKNVTDGPLSQLLMAARNEKLQVVALSHPDNALYLGAGRFKMNYNKGPIVANAGRLLKDKKAIILADDWMINTSLGVLEPAQGLAQGLAIPGFMVDSAGKIRFLKDQTENRNMIFVTGKNSWTPLFPVHGGEFLGWRSYGDNYTFVTHKQRLESVLSQIDFDKEGFKKEYDKIFELALKHRSMARGSCGRVSEAVWLELRSNDIELGSGATLGWYQKDGGKYVFANHTAPSVIIRGKEYIVDAAHLQFPHDVVDEIDGVIVLERGPWANEILSRNKAYNPFMAYKWFTNSSLWAFDIPGFLRPVRKQK